MKATLITYAFLMIAFLWPIEAGAKGDGGVGFWMEGTVTELKTDGDRISFMLKGKFRFQQYEGNTSKQITVDGRNGIPITIRQNDPFFAFSPDWRGGAIQEAGGLLRIVKAASLTGNRVKFELLGPTIVFDSKHNLTLSDAAVIRASDVDLR